jgi:hypothetical protein
LTNPDVDAPLTCWRPWTNTQEALAFEKEQYDAMANKAASELSQAQHEFVAAYRNSQGAEALLLHPDRRPKQFGK